MKLAIILGTRPEIIRLSRVIVKAKEYFDLVLIHTGQNWDKALNEVFFEELEIPAPNYRLHSAGKTPGETIGNIVKSTYEILEKESPDALLILGDTNSALSVISAKRLKIPIFHMEAGNRSFDSNVPEEINRKIVDVTADINIAYTEHARRYLIAEGHRDDSVLLSGSPLWEVLSYYQDKIETNSILTRLGLESNHYFLVSIHREENLDLKNNFKTILNALKVIQEKYLLRIIFSTHPRTKIKLEQSGEIGDYRDLIEFHEPFSYFEYIKLIKNTFCFISDSGTISEEAACLQVPAVCIRNSIERPEAIEHGNTVLSGLELKDITLSIDLARSLDRSVIPEAYKVEDVSDRILKMILSRYHTVNRRTWNK